MTRWGERGHSPYAGARACHQVPAALESTDPVLRAVLTLLRKH